MSNNKAKKSTKRSKCTSSKNTNKPEKETDDGKLFKCLPVHFICILISAIEHYGSVNCRTSNKGNKIIFSAYNRSLSHFSLDISLDNCTPEFTKILKTLPHKMNLKQFTETIYQVPTKK